MRKYLILLVAALFSVGLFAPTLASAAPGNTPHPTPSHTQTAQAGSGLLKACKDSGWKALYTPIPVGTPAPANDPATPAVNEANATVYVFASRDQCRATVNAGLPIGLISGLPAAVISVVAPANFPTPPLPAAVAPPPVVSVTVNAAGSATTPFGITVNGSGFGNNAAVTIVVTYRDGHSQAFAATTSATGTVSFALGGSCSPALAASTVTIVQTPTGPAASAGTGAICPA